jgi:hypothetical protein
MVRTMRLIFCGGHEFEDRAAVERAMRRLINRCGSFVVVVPGATGGVGAIAGEIGEALGLAVEVSRDDGQQRGPTVLESGVDGVVAFPGGAGTTDMFEQARVASVPIWSPMADEVPPAAFPAEAPKPCHSVEAEREKERRKAWMSDGPAARLMDEAMRKAGLKP